MWGKIAGAAIGFLTGRWVGLLIGAVIGHQLDVLWKNKFQGALLAKIRFQFFERTFEVMGHIAKADGHVCQAEIDSAESVMEQMGLVGEQRQQAIVAFNRGKLADFDLHRSLNPLRVLCRRKPDLLRVFMTIQLRMAAADGHISSEELLILRQCCAHLGFDLQELENWLASLQTAGQQAGGRQENAKRQQQAPNRNTPGALAQSYSILGVDANTPDAAVKKAYRRLISQHHPDKLAARGLPEEMRTLAEEQTKTIQTAWEQVARARGLR